jgi:hypothetical protein
MSDNVSSSVLFHFTNSIENLESILKDGFIARCCPEYALDLLDEDALEKHTAPCRAFAMVCFCDLPLSLIGKHLREYGNFGIGLNKDWGIEHGLEPVIYSHKNGQTRPSIRRLQELANQRVIDDVPSTAYGDLEIITAYTKRHRGKPWRSGKTKNEVHFYDEREWRYVPMAPWGSPYYLTRDDYFNKVKTDEILAKIKAQGALKIRPNDIQYLIVPDDSHILELHRFLKRLYSVDDAIVVTTAIMTIDCISEDV